MAVFRYKTYDGAGRLVSGMIDADSAEVAMARLKGRGLFPFEVVREIEEGGRHEEKRKEGRRARRSEIILFTRQLASLVASGMPILECLSALAEQSSGSALRRVVVEMKEAIAAGLSLSEALSRYPRLFSPTYVNLVKAGERGGDLDRILEELAVLGEKEAALRGKVMAAMIYPLFMTLVGSAVLTALFIVVIPQVIGIFGNMGRALPLPTRLLVAITHFIHTWWPLLFALLALLLFSLHRLGRTHRGRGWIDRTLLRLPLAGPLITRMEVSRFARTLALLLKGGVPVTQAIDIAKGVVKNSAIAENVARARENIAEGGDLSPPLREEGLFPPVAVHMIAVGEKGGNLEQMLLHVAEGFDREVEAYTTGLASLVEPVLILVMGLAVGFIALSVLLPIFDMNMMVAR